MTKKQFVKLSIIVAKYAALAAAFFILFAAEIDTSISPFALSFLFACIFLPVSAWATVAICFICSLFSNTSHSETLLVVFAVAVFLVFCYLKKRFKKLSHPIAVIIGYVLSNALAVIQSFETQVDFYKVMISIIVGGVFLACAIVTISASRVKRTKIPWTADQKICAAVILIIIALGLGGLESPYFSVHKCVTVFVILAGIYWFDAKGTLAVAVCLGLGQSLVQLNLNYVAISTLLCVVAMAFRSRKHTYSIIALIFADIVLGTYFDAYINYSFYSLISLVVAVAIFVLIPARLSRRFDPSTNTLSDNLVSKNTINKNRAGIYSKLNNLAGVFGEMQNTYRALIQPNINHEENKVLLGGQVGATVCENCPNKTNCNRTPESSVDVKDSLESLCYVGLHRGTVNFLDIPHVMAMNCTRIGAVLSATNNLLKQHKSNTAATVTLDAGKLLMAQLLVGLNKLMLVFAKEVCASVVFDNERAAEIKEELLYKNIVANDCLITKSSLNEYSVSVLVSKSDSMNRAIEQVISRVVKHKMLTDSIDDSETAGFAIVTVKTAPRFRVVFGVAQIGKNFNEHNGDVFSFLKVNNEKTIMAICDGMGAGTGAQRSSVIALSLVENFYKAGFPNEIIMTSVNQLLTITNQEIFSALDIAVFNLASGEVDFVKVGASDGFIKRQREVEVIEAGSLPIGILEEMQPKITRAVLGIGDYVILISDGISDSFGERIALPNFINNLTVKNSQELADTIMQEALNRNGRMATDDCTVIVAKILD